MSDDSAADPILPDGAVPAAGPAADGLGPHAPFPDVAAAAGAVLAELRRQLGFSFWAVTRVTGQSYLLLTDGGGGFPLPPGEPARWAETLCHHVAVGRAPRVVPDVSAVPSLAGIPVVARWDVGAYLSVPLSVDGRTLFGTVCALDHAPVHPDVARQLPLVDLQARLLSTLIGADLRIDEQRRHTERAQADALSDPLTGLVNRRGWQLLLDREEQRCRRYAVPAAVLVIDLDGLKAVNDLHGHPAGDALLRHAAQVLRDSVRRSDAVARLGGDEFAVLAVETDSTAAHHERDRIAGRLHTAGVTASVGVATRGNQGLHAAWAAADTDMYRHKHQGPADGAR